MDWKNEAVEKLRRYDAMRASLDNIPTELERLAAQARAVRAADPGRVNVGGTRVRQEDALLSNLVCRQELECSLEQAHYWVKAVEGALCALEPEERLILEKLYIYPRKNAADWLCGELNMERSSVYRRRDRALRQFTVAMYGKE